MKTKLAVYSAVMMGMWLAIGSVADAQCLLGRLFNRPTTYTAGYGGYPVGVAYTPVTTYMPVVSSAPVTMTSYRVTYLPVTPGASTVYRVAPAVTAPAVSTTSYLPVATPYAVASPVTTPAVVPVVTYRPVQIVYEPRRRLFPWRPFANWRARRAGYWPLASSTPTWSTAYFATYEYIPAATTSAVCTPMESGIVTVGSYDVTTSTGCSSCASSTAGSWSSSPAAVVPTLPPTSSSSQPTPTFKQESGSETRMKPTEEGQSGPSASGTSLPLSQEKPVVRQALYEKPIPLVEDEANPPLVEVHGWRRSQ